MHTDQPIQSRKRQHSEQDSLATSPKQADKKQKVDHLGEFQVPTAFWDSLSKVWLTPNALRELDRRNKQAPTSPPQEVQLLRPITRRALRDIQKLARQGGPNLSELRGVRVYESFYNSED
jgi:hypothetical protein